MRYLEYLSLLINYDYIMDIRYKEKSNGFTIYKLKTKNGFVITYFCNKLKLIRKISCSNGYYCVYTYNSKGQKIKFRDSKGYEQLFIYNKNDSSVIYCCYLLNGEIIQEYKN